MNGDKGSIGPVMILSLYCIVLCWWI